MYAQTVPMEAGEKEREKQHATRYQAHHERDRKTTLARCATAYCQNLALLAHESIGG